MGYQSGYTDPTTGDVNMAARWYQPGTGTFGSRDTWQLDPTPSGQANRYGYGSGRALNGTDPSGHCFWDACVVEGYATIAALTVLAGYASYELSHGNYFSSSGSGTTTGHYTHTYDSALSPDAGDLAGALSAQAGNVYVPGSSALTYTGPGTGTYACTYNCGGYTITTPRVITPPKPPIDQNPNNGKHPKPAPDRGPVKPDWGGKGSGGWQPGDGVDMVIGVLKMLELAGNDQYDPNKALETLPAPVDNPGGKNDGRDRDDDKCDVGPGVSPTGHAVYLPRERYYDTREQRYECRATGVYGLLDQSDYNKGRKAPGTNTNDSTQPPGMNEIRDMGYVPANGHLIPAAAKGSGIDLRNLVAEYEKANHSYISYGVEADIRRPSCRVSTWRSP
ncbi:RHS repeat-associated core domain-containing protein [Streptomyces canus]|uniref:RHS repeat-associated core domain-containing protein n=1 Tax=Streptomyces canus TaxID=58343 RepID=UPI003827CAE4